MNILEELKWRGLLKQCTNDAKVIDAQANHSAVYCGFDPSGGSLHVGHLIQLILLERFNRAGFKPIAIIGGGTGRIGDPSGKKSERLLLSDEQVLNNVNKLTTQISRLIPNVKILNNNEWLSKIGFIDFLRDVGKYFNLNYMLSKENVATRIETGISFTEFAYALLQSKDFHHLYVNHNCCVQVGGSDQWGNITSGIEFIRKMEGDANRACGVTMQLLLKPDGTKFGKSENGAIWLEAALTSPYNFYQFFYNQPDDVAEQLLRFMTFLDEKEIEAIKSNHLEAPSRHIGQTRLAEELTKFVHGNDNLLKAQQISQLLFSNKIAELNEEHLKMIQIGGIDVKSISHNCLVIDALVHCNVASSKGDAKILIKQNAISVNGKKIVDENAIIDDAMLLFDKYIIIKKGKRSFNLLIVQEGNR